MWETVKKIRNSYIFDYVGLPINCERNLIHRNHIYENTDKIINLLGLDNVKNLWKVMDNVTTETCTVAGEMFTYLNYCPHSLMTVSHRVFQNGSLRDFLVAMSSIQTNAKSISEKEISLKIWNKLMEKCNMSYSHIERISSGKTISVANNTFDMCFNSKMFKDEMCSQFLHSLGIGYIYTVYNRFKLLFESE